MTNPATQEIARRAPPTTAAASTTAGEASRHFQMIPSATNAITTVWVWRQLIEATSWDRQPRYLIHDHDRVWGGGPFCLRIANRPRHPG